MKSKINELRYNIDYRLKRYCGRLSPAKRTVTVLAACIVFAAANIWFVASSIYGAGKRSVETELMNMRHIETLELQSKQDSINQLKQKRYEYK